MDAPKKISTTIRLDVEASAKINNIVEESGASQSDVIRHLVDVALGDTTKYVFAKPDVVPDEAKTLLMECADNLAGIRNELNRIGNNINVKRKMYNIRRKELEDMVTGYDDRIRTETDFYKKLKATEEQRTLKLKLEQFDNQPTQFVSENEWERFNFIKISIENLMIVLGEKVNDISSITVI